MCVCVCRENRAVSVDSVAKGGLCEGHFSKICNHMKERTVRIRRKIP